MTSNMSPPPIFHTTPAPIEAKLVLLGSQGVGKTSIVSRFISPHIPLTSHPSTVGASFVTKKIVDADTSTTVRLQIWDTAGQERFRSISRLYYRGAHVGLLCYDITDEKSWEDMKGWLRELRENCSEDNEAGPIIHVVGTKSDLVTLDPSTRQVPFERTIAYVTEQLGGLGTAAMSQASTPPVTLKQSNFSFSQQQQQQPQSQQQQSNNPKDSNGVLQSPSSKRSSGFWTADFGFGWDSCHEVNAKDGEGIEEVFRVIARKLVEQRTRREEMLMQRTPATRGEGPDSGDYFAYSHGVGSLRLGGPPEAKRRSWLGLSSVGLGINVGGGGGLAGAGTGGGLGVATSSDGGGEPGDRGFDDRDEASGGARRRGRCC